MENHFLSRSPFVFDSSSTLHDFHAQSVEAKADLAMTKDALTDERYDEHKTVRADFGVRPPQRNHPSMSDKSKLSMSLLNFIHRRD